MMMKTYRIVWVALACIVAGSTGPVYAQNEAGAVAALQGSMELESAGKTREARIGSPILVGEQMRTGVDARAKIVLRDGSVLNLGPGSALSVDRQELDVAGGRYDTVLTLRGGLLRAWVGEPYGMRGARFEVETPTAVASVRGAEVVVVHDAAGEESEIVNISGDLEVAPKLGVIGGSVNLEPGSATRVQKGRFPTSPEAASAGQVAAYGRDLDIMGTGHRDGLNVLHPAVMGRLLSTKDAPTGVLRQARKPDGKRVEPPAGFFAQRYSPDVRTNTEPLLEFKQTPPGVPSVN